MTDTSGGGVDAQDVKPGVWDWALALESPALRDLHARWSDRCREGRLPGRSDFDPVEMRDLLGILFLLKAEPDGDDFRYSLIGSGITDHTGRDNTGRTVGEVFGPVGLELYSRVRDSGRPVRVHGVVDWVGKDHKRYETVILPLADDGKTVNRFIGAMVFGSTVGRVR